MTNSTRRTAAELCALSEHVLYEVQMLFAMADHLRDHVKGIKPLPWGIEMACIESFAVHSRVLYKFVWHDPKPNAKHQDCFASEFFPPGEWVETRNRVQKSKLDGLWDRTGAEIVHLSYSRITIAAGEWEFDVVAGVFGMAFRLFLENVDKALVAPGFEDRMRAAWPEYLNWSYAASFPPDRNPYRVATTTPQDMSQVRVASFEEMLTWPEPRTS